MRHRRAPLATLAILFACHPPPEDAESTSAAIGPPQICLPTAVDDHALLLRGRPALAKREINLRRILATLAAQTSDPLDSADTIYANMVATLGRAFAPGVVLDSWYGVAMVNRFDLAPADGRTCGEYRIVVSRERAGQFGNEPSRFTFIFEASVPNPTPRRGLDGCRPLQQAWAALSAMTDDGPRADALATMFFEGTAGFPPLVHVDNYGASGEGQVRANFFLNADLGPWILDEFVLVPVSRGDDENGRPIQTVQFVDRPVADTLGVDIMAAGPPANLVVEALRNDFVAQLDALAAPSPADIRYSVPESFRSASSTAIVNPSFEGMVTSFVAQGGDNSHFGQQIAAGMAARGITGITPTQMVRRAFTQSCGGCHDDAGPSIGGGATLPINFPPGSVFLIDPNGQTSGALNAFLPGRVANLQRFLSCRL